MEKSKKKILIIGNCYYSVFRFRKEIIQRLVLDGYDVWTSFPNGEHQEKEKGEECAEKIGCHYVSIAISRRSYDFRKEVQTICRIEHLISAIEPDVLLLFTIKPNLYGGLLARKKRIPYVINVTGLGSAFNKNPLVVWAVKCMYSWSIEGSVCTFFQNHHDYKALITKQCKAKIEMLPGSGVNIDEYSPLPFHDDEVVRFLYMSRLMKEKGIEEYMRAAEYYSENKNIEFLICGDCEELYLDQIERLEKKGVLFYYGQVSNVKELLQKSDCVVHPSFYHEGISNVLLEAMACGRAIITTDNPGCRELVIDGQNGFMIEPKDTMGLINAINAFAFMPKERRVEMGMQGRSMVEKQYNRQIVVDAYEQVIEGIVGR